MSLSDGLAASSPSPVPDTLEFGLNTFGDVSVGADGEHLPMWQVLRDVVAEAELADRLGLDHFAVGEHHRDDYAISAPEIVLATIAGRTERIRLGTAVTVLSSNDPVRLYEQFATLDALSNGRAEPILGRGSFTESFPLFGYDLQDYETLFEEKLELFTKLQSEKPVSWSGSTRAPLHGQQVWPPTERGTIPAWIAVGGSPQSIVRTAQHGMPLMLAIIGGSPAGFVPMVNLFHRALDQLGQQRQPVGAHLPGHVAATDEEARETLFPHWAEYSTRIGRERGWAPATREQFDAVAGPEGALVVGDPETVAQKIAWTVRTLGLSRFDLKYANGRVPHEALMRSIELYATEVVPRVRELLAD
jgi:probable LLM family oxidoreductase